MPIHASGCLFLIILIPSKELFSIIHDHFISVPAACLTPDRPIGLSTILAWTSVIVEEPHGY